MEEILIPIMALSIPIIIVPTALSFRHARHLREVEHKERMRALEMGRTLPGDEASPMKLAGGIGIAVPLGSLALAWLAGTSSRDLGESMGFAASLVGLGGVICGTILALRHAAGRRDSAPQGVQKAEYDPDAYDVVGRRG